MTDGMTSSFSIVKFPFLSSNILSAPVYGVQASQLIRYATACTQDQDFVKRERLLTTMSDVFVTA